MKKRTLSILFIIVLLISCCNNTIFAKSTIPNITYKAHVQNIGWMNSVSAGTTAGTTGNGYRMEALKINLMDNNNSMIKYRAHVQNIGWGNWVYSGTTVGTTGMSYRMEAIEIKLRTAYINNYDIYYRVHVSNCGWLGWAKNGETAGSTGIGAQIEAIQIKLVNKGTIISSSATATIKPSLSYKSHASLIGWMDYVNQGQISGTTGQSKQLEAFKIKLTDPYGVSNITYNAHVSNIGWQGWKTSGNIAGTTGQSKAIEAIQIQLTGILNVYYDIYYRVHCANIGWLGWAKNGAYAGTTGGSIQAEALQIKIVPKGTAFNTEGTAYYNKSISTIQNSSEFDPIWPCSNTYTVTTLYKYSSGAKHSCYFKYGIDVGAPKGENVLAIESGTVIYSGYSTTSGFGNYIKIQHNNGKISLYAHLNTRTVSTGTKVCKGQIIGTVGNSSAKYKNMGSHLHFELGNNNSSGAAGDSYQEYYKSKYANKIILTQAAKKYNKP